MISRATPAQADAIGDLISRLANYFVADTEAPAAQAFLSSFSSTAIQGLISNQEFACYTNCMDSEVRGFIALRNHSHIHHLFVAPEDHRQGIAKALWENAKKDALANGINGRFTVNSSVYAVPIYERFGFQALDGVVERNGVRYVPMALA